MRPSRPAVLALAVAAAAVLSATAPAQAAPAGGAGSGGDGARGPVPLRVATYNASLNRATDGELVRDLRVDGDEAQDAQVRNVAEVVQRQRPDVLLLEEFDYDARGEALDLFRDGFLERGQGGAEPIDYPYALALPSNTGIPTGKDLNGNGVVAGGDEAYGFGEFPGQYGFVVLSRYPIDLAGVRTFQRFLWKDMPGNRLPVPFYAPDEVDLLRLSSKNHADVPIQVGRSTVHLLASHPTPPTFDGPEDRNGRRNADEIRLFADYVTPGRGNYLYDDDGVRGGLRPGARFVIAGDLNSDPADGDSVPGAVAQVLDAPRVQDPLPRSDGAVEQSALQGRANLTHRGDPQYDTADFADGAPGNLRVDYVLPSAGLRVVGAGVFWPVASDPLSRLVGTFDPRLPGGFPSSDHKLVAVDLRVPPRAG